jgi:putative hydrolase of HD superfamily
MGVNPVATAKEIIQLGRQSETLKRVMRAGWSLAGVNRARTESVADHSYGTALLSLLISKQLMNDKEEIDLGKVASMALFHDIPEALTSDIPQTELQLGREMLSAGKREAEKDAISVIADIAKDFKDWLENLWVEQQDQSSLESRIVSSADVLDMLIHVLTLEESGVSPSILDQFFTSSHSRLVQIGIKIVSDIFWELYDEHLENAKRMGITLSVIDRNPDSS